LFKDSDTFQQDSILRRHAKTFRILLGRFIMENIGSSTTLPGFHMYNIK
jgi:hypothetical protein